MRLKRARILSCMAADRSLELLEFFGNHGFFVFFLILRLLTGTEGGLENFLASSKRGEQQRASALTEGELSPRLGARDRAVRDRRSSLSRCLSLKLEVGYPSSTSLITVPQLACYACAHSTEAGLLLLALAQPASVLVPPSHLLLDFHLSTRSLIQRWRWVLNKTLECVERALGGD